MDESELQSADDTSADLANEVDDGPEGDLHDAGDEPYDDGADEGYEDADAAAADDEDADDDDDDDDEDVDGDEDDAADDEDEDEDAHATVVSAPTVEEARRLALEGLRKIVPSVDEADVEFVVREEGNKGGFFGRGKIEAQVEARLRPSGQAPTPSDEGPPPGAEALRAFVQTVVDLMGVEASVEAYDTPDAVHAEISGDDLGILIGRHGTTIDALQYVAAIAVNGDRRHRRQVVIDAEGYRTRREVSLKALADRMAQKVARESGSVQLKPMTAAERKVIHLHLKDDPRVETASEGQEPFRSVVVSPRSRRA
jgi:spoIIIJ-associated protein